MITGLVNKLRILPRWVIILIDLFIVAFSTFLGYLLRFNFAYQRLLDFDYEVGILVNITCALLVILATQSYAGIVRYTGVEDGFRILKVSVLSLTLVLFVNLIYFYSYQYNLIPYSVIFIAFLASSLFLYHYRLVVKSVFLYYKNAVTAQKSNVVIFGAGELGIITKQAIEGGTSSDLKVVGFVEDDRRKVGKDLNGTKIYNASDLKWVIDYYQVYELIIAIRNVSVKRKNEIVDICLKKGVNVRAVPPAEQWVKGHLSLNQIRNINIEDLLGRESIRLDSENISHEIKDRVIMVTGAAGSIGSELVRQVISYDPKLLVLFDQSESDLYEVEKELETHRNGHKVISVLGDIRNKQRLETIFEAYRPHVVLHAAAYKHVPVMENNPSEAIGCNVIGTKNVADLAVAYGVYKFVLISTDKAVNPTSIMGCSKRIAEIYVQSYHQLLQSDNYDNTSFITTRFGNVLGSKGSVIPYFKKQITDGGPITVTHPDIERYFMTIPEACQLVLEAGAMGKGGEIFIFDMGKSIRIIDLAKKMIKLSGLEEDKDIEIVYTGLRQGEKLYEELLNNQENTSPTHHSKILIAQVRIEDYQAVSGLLQNMEKLIGNNQEMGIVKMMKRLVPEFSSNNSRFEMLDQEMV